MFESRKMVKSREERANSTSIARFLHNADCTRIEKKRYQTEKYCWQRSSWLAWKLLY